MNIQSLYNIVKNPVTEFMTDVASVYGALSTVAETSITGEGGFLDNITDVFDDAYGYITGDARDEYISKNLIHDFDNPALTAPSSLYSDLSGLYNKGRGYITTAQDLYAEYKDSPVGRFIDAAAGPVGDAGFGGQQRTRVARAQVPGGVSAGNFRSTAVDLRAGFADPRISNAMQNALRSENPRVKLALSTINPTIGIGGMNIRTGSTTVKAPKIRKFSSKKAKSKT